MKRFLLLIIVLHDIEALRFAVAREVFVRLLLLDRRVEVRRRFLFEHLSSLVVIDAFGIDAVEREHRLLLYRVVLVPQRRRRVRPRWNVLDVNQVGDIEVRVTQVRLLLLVSLAVAAAVASADDFR